MSETRPPKTADEAGGRPPARFHQLLQEAARLHNAALNPEGWPDVVQAVQRRVTLARNSGDLSPEQIMWLQSVIDGAARICAEVARLQLARAAAGLAWNTVAPGIVALDAAGQVLRANPRAGRVLGGLEHDLDGQPAAVLEPDSQLARFVTLLKSRPEWPARGATTPALMRVATGRQELEILAVPLRTTEDPFSLPDARMLLFVVDPDSDEGPGEETLAAAFGLTAAEARVAARLARGDTIGAAAAAIGIRITTARTHLARLFMKTETRRQADLIRTLLAVPTPAR